MTFPFIKITNAEAFIERMAALYIGATQIRAMTNEGDQRAGTY